MSLRTVRLTWARLRGASLPRLRGRDRDRARPRSYATRASYLVGSEAAMEDLAIVFADVCLPGDLFLLSGTFGVGKSVFCRAFIRRACADDALPVPSPSFLLHNAYDAATGPPLHHFDLYRLPPGANLERLQVEQQRRTGVCLVEWPEHFCNQLPREAVSMDISVVTRAAWRAAVVQHPRLALVQTAEPQDGLVTASAARVPARRDKAGAAPGTEQALGAELVDGGLRLVRLELGTAELSDRHGAAWEHAQAWDPPPEPLLLRDDEAMALLGAS